MYFIDIGVLIGLLRDVGSENVAGIDMRANEQGERYIAACGDDSKWKQALKEIGLDAPDYSSAVANLQALLRQYKGAKQGCCRARRACTLNRAFTSSPTHFRNRRSETSRTRHGLLAARRILPLNTR